MSAGLHLERLEFDPASPAAGPNVGAYLRAGSDGDKLTSTLLSGKEALDVNIAGSDIDITVDLDLDDLVADDEVDTEDPLKIGSRSIAQSSVLAAISAAGDKANAISDLYRRIYTTSAPGVGWSAVSGTTSGTPSTATQVDTAKQAGRQYWMFQNQSTSKEMYLGPSGVSEASGIEVGKGATQVMSMGQALDLYVICGTASQPYRFVQVG